VTQPSFSGQWNYPTRISAGVGSIEELTQACGEVDISAPLIVTDPGIAGLPMLESLLSRCCRDGLGASVFSQIKSNPNHANVSDGVAAFSGGGHDGVIGFGGGSALDATKAIALMIGQPGELWDLEGPEGDWHPSDESLIPPVIAIPTTAGTGSEVGRAALITDEQRQVKKIIFHPKLLPARVFLDPELTRGLPPALTAATGMDALSHNLEALCANSYHPMAEGIAVEGIRLVKGYLPLAVADGNDMDARMQMLVASSMGATAFQKGLGAMHALAHPLGALYDAHHGLLNAILMPYVLNANRAVIDERIARAASYIGLADASFEGFLSWVMTLREQLAIPHSLAEIGIDTALQSRVGEMATQDPTAASNPIVFSPSQYADIFARAVNGDLENTGK